MRWSLPAVVVVGFLCLRSGIAFSECQNLFLSVDEQKRNSLLTVDVFDRDNMRYMLKALLPIGSDLDESNPHLWRLDCSNLNDSLATDLRHLSDANRPIDFRSVRTVFEKHYFNTISTRGQADIIKPRLEELAAVTTFKDWPSKVIPVSPIKGRTRVIFRSPPGFLPVMSVSQTLNSNTGDRDASVLETEVAIRGTERLDWDFYAYTAEGDLAPYSTFPGGRKPTPRICIGCHYDSQTHQIDRLLLR